MCMIMKRVYALAELWAVCLLLCFGAGVLHGQSPKRVLFVGNSYVYTNNLPQVLAQIARCNGKEIVCESSTSGGFTFRNHLNSVQTLAKIEAGGYDCIVLQGQSQEVAFPDNQFYSQVYPYAGSLDSICKLHNPQARVVFFATWGYRYGDAMNCPFYEPFCSFEGMTQRLTDNYTLMARDFRSDVSPVGEAFLQSFLSDSTVVLHSSDNSHPSVLGTYLAACCFYCAVFEEALPAAPAFGGVSAERAEYLRGIANDVVFERWNEWSFAPSASGDLSLQAAEGAELRAWLLSSGLLRVEGRGASGEVRVEFVSAEGRRIGSAGVFVPMNAAADVPVPQHKGLMFVRLTGEAFPEGRVLPVVNY